MGIPIGEWSGSAATEALHQTMKEFNQEAAKQGATMVWLSYAMTLFSVCLTCCLWRADLDCAPSLLRP